MKVAALDLGTNTFLCLIAEGENGRLTKVHRDLVQTVRLGQGVDKSNRFHPEALERAEKCLTEFKQEIDKHGVDHILAMATSAARDAENGPELFKIGERLGIPIEIIPGSDEARITYQGAMVGHPPSPKVALIVDIGGGSTELIQGRGENILFAKSLNLGGVRLTEKFITAQPIAEKESIEATQFIRHELQSVLLELRRHPVDQIIAVAGTPTSIAAIELGGFDEKKIDGYYLSRERLAHWVREFSRTSVEEKKNKYNLGGRADIIFIGASILLALLDELGQNGFYVSTKGVRYGIALEILRRHRD